jgi:hypothetical protein
MDAYGVTAELGEQLDAARNVATGGTLFGNPLSAAAAKAALTEVLVPDAYAHASALGSQLADGIEQGLARQPRHLGSAARRRPHHRRPRHQHGRGPPRQRLQRTARPAALTQADGIQAHPAPGCRQIPPLCQWPGAATVAE